MEPILVIKKLLENRLLTLSPALPTAFEGVYFTPPTTKYLRAVVNMRQPDDSVLGSSYYREIISFNVYVVDQINIGTGGAISTAGAIRDLFQKGTAIVEDNVTIKIIETPQIQGTSVASERLVVPVLISAIAEVVR